MSQIDWVGGGVEPRAFRDIRSTREGVAARKAALCLELGSLVNRVPASVMAAGIERTREWVAARTKAARVVGSSRASEAELSAAVASMRMFEAS